LPSVLAFWPSWQWRQAYCPSSNGAKRPDPRTQVQLVGSIWAFGQRLRSRTPVTYTRRRGNVRTSISTRRRENVGLCFQETRKQTIEPQPLTPAARATRVRVFARRTQTRARQTAAAPTPIGRSAISTTARLHGPHRTTALSRTNHLHGPAGLHETRLLPFPLLLILPMVIFSCSTFVLYSLCNHIRSKSTNILLF
jgi:hypothetical protein